MLLEEKKFWRTDWSSMPHTNMTFAVYIPNCHSRVLKKKKLYLAFDFVQSLILFTLMTSFLGPSAWSLTCSFAALHLVFEMFIYSSLHHTLAICTIISSLFSVFDSLP